MRTVKKTKPFERKTRQTRKLVHHVDKGNATNDLSSIYTLHSPEDYKQYNVPVCLTVKKSEAATKFQTDTGASCSILTLQDYKKITDEKAPQPTNTPLVLYDRSVINPISSNTLNCEDTGVRKKVPFEIVDHPPKSLLSAEPLNSSCKGHRINEIVL